MMAAEDWIDLAYGEDDFLQRLDDQPRHMCGEAHDTLRQNRTTGEYFIGCDCFPECRYSRPLTYQKDFRWAKRAQEGR